MEDMIKHIKERNKKMLEFMDKNSSILGKEIIQSKSEVSIFNIIGTFATDKGYNPIYFKTKSLSTYNDDLRLVDVHYIHIYDDFDLKVSIYYDKNKSILSNINIPYYEMYDGSKTKRFFDNKEDETTLVNEAVIKL